MICQGFNCEYFTLMSSYIREAFVVIVLPFYIKDVRMCVMCDCF